MVKTTSIETYHSIRDSGVLSEKRMNVFDIFYENPNRRNGSF